MCSQVAKIETCINKYFQKKVGKGWVCSAGPLVFGGGEGGEQDHEL